MASSEGKDFAFEHRLQLPDGTIKYLQIMAHSSSIESNGGVEFVGAVMDVTERKRSEEALDKVRLDLVHVSRISTLGQMAASIAHEINQPLAGIVLNGNASLRWLAGDPPNLDEAREATRRIVRDGQRAGDVITRLRSLFRREGPPAERRGVNEVIQEVIALTRGDVQKGGATIQTQMAAELPLVTGDRVQLQQLMLNLIMNAVDGRYQTTARVQHFCSPFRGTLPVPPSYRSLISVVDDDDSIRESLQGLLESIGFEVETFSSAQAFLDSTCLGSTDC